ncbi:PREDICTED: uncharacterized protein LOC108617585 isoform X2 [Drosophila arizonae]|uniref:Uncharacterized protein LOC108617585 isoform X2 n=1 Tax=Drosophila arizonae TaxID=7263 RepID=A0ABM1PNW3_DROAR|nr:PREDICTED: uncharacterized protein LOC108617585 isoform X2 [Drosophila arizonae]
MWSKAQLAPASPEIIEIYRNKGFEDTSLDTVRAARSVTVTSAGELTVKDIGIPRGRVIRAELRLPDLQERCEGSNNNQLFKLSKILADNEYYQGRQVEDSNHMEGNMARGQNVNPWNRTVQVQVPKKYFRANEPVDKPRMETVSVKPFKLSSDISSILQKKSQKSREFMNTDMNTDESDSSGFEVLENRRRIEPVNRPIVEKRNKQTQVKMVAKQSVARPKRLKDEGRYARAIKMCHKVIHIMNFKDNWPVYIVIMCLCTIAYLIYKVHIDLMNYGSSERLYAKKMSTSSKLMKILNFFIRWLHKHE